MAAFNLSLVVLGGRLTRDPELKTTASGATVCSFSVAVNQPTKKGEEKQADFIDCVAWNSTAEFITRYFRKASSICVVGKLRQRTWEAKDGTKRSVLEVIADNAHFVDAKDEMPSAREDPLAHAPSYIPEAYLRPREAPAAPVYEEITDQEEPPF